MNTEHTTVLLTRTSASGETFTTNYDSRIAPLGEIAGALLRDMGAEPICPAPDLPDGYRCDGCDCERVER